VLDVEHRLAVVETKLSDLASGSVGIVALGNDTRLSGIEETLYLVLPGGTSGHVDDCATEARAIGGDVADDVY